MGRVPAEDPAGGDEQEPAEGPEGQQEQIGEDLGDRPDEDGARNGQQDDEPALDPDEIGEGGARPLAAHPGPGDQAGHERCQQESDLPVNVAEKGLEGDEQGHFGEDRGESHPGHGDEDPVSRGSAERPEEDQGQGKGDEGRVQDPRGGDPGEESQEVRFEPPELGRPEDGVEIIAHGDEVPVDAGRRLADAPVQGRDADRMEPGGEHLAGEEPAFDAGLDGGLRQLIRING